ncbi:copper amine oxidase N-terminal domain-containing protein [Gordoniibacillus kamchatkensis]|uniref:copper amine oxidase N-terminal domain-containing protein n=1 Tax=Gordoniibacillus kamchatkensis TaxID=1590651 RepID=UPI000695FE15|nr:copper amine oxidase N-terminal domain-containing protein [Paenibacillus sp. VKM B-2647]
MKKIAIAGMAGIALTAFGAGVYAASDIRLLVHGKQVNADVRIIDGSSYVPLRAVSEALGMDVNWDNATRTISIKKTKTYKVNSVIWSGDARMKISAVTLDTAFQNEKTDHPIHALIFDVSIDSAASRLKWNPTQGKIRINQQQTVDISKPVNYSDDLDGAVVYDKVKKGNIVVEVSGDLDEIKTVEFVIDGSTDGHTYNNIQQIPIELK